MGNDDDMVVLYYADWCQPCQRFKPVFEQVVKQFNLVIRYVDIDRAPKEELRKNIGLESIPSVGAWKDGEFVDLVKGGEVDDAESLKKWVNYIFNL